LSLLDVVLRDDGSAVLIDFGMATTLGDLSHQIAMGTHNYLAPEARDGAAQFSSDVWSAGVLCYELISGGELPFGPASARANPRTNRPHPFAPHVLAGCADADTAARWTRAICELMLEPNPFKRPLASDILDYVQGITTDVPLPKVDTLVAAPVQRVHFQVKSSSPPPPLSSAAQTTKRNQPIRLPWQMSSLKRNDVDDRRDEQQRSKRQRLAASSSSAASLSPTASASTALASKTKKSNKEDYLPSKYLPPEDIANRELPPSPLRSARVLSSDASSILRRINSLHSGVERS
jgi:serine/threonine protein kinase